MTTEHPEERGLEWTGERYVPEVPGNIRLEHVHRYLLARELVTGQRVLDIACGEGYGSSLLAANAAHVFGVDIAPQAVEHADRRYRSPRLSFAAGSATAIPLANASVDAVVSFETIEHLEDHEQMLQEVRRVLTPDGVLIISSPDRHEYSDVPGYRNPFHAHELYRHEFESLLASHFRSVTLVGQRVKAGSVIAPLEPMGAGAFLDFRDADGPDRRTEGLRAPLYLIAVATDGPPIAVPIGVLDGGDFVWALDQEQAIRDVLDRGRSDSVLANARHEAAAAELRSALDRHFAWTATVVAAKTTADEKVRQLQEEVDRRGARIAELEAAVATLQLASDAAHHALDSTRAELEASTTAHRAELADWQLRESALSARTHSLEAAHTALLNTINEIRNSRSWRLTAPLRAFGRARPIAPTSAPVPPASAPLAANDVLPHGPESPAAESAAVPVQPSPGVSERPNRPSIVVVSHDAHFYGAQRLALFVARTLATDLSYDVDIVLCAGGPLEAEFAAVGRVHDFYASTADARVETARQLYARGARVAICNTSCVGETVHVLKEAGFTVVSLIHELPGLIAQYQLEASSATIAREADKVVFGAGVVRDAFVSMTGLDPDKVVVRPQGLLAKNRYAGRRAEARAELHRRFGLADHIRIVVAVASAHLRKGPDLFVEAGLAVLAERDDVVFIWVGHTNADGYQIAAALVAAGGAEDRFFFPGVIEDSDVFFAGADVYLMTSREDPFPSVVLHALDAELPVVGFADAGGFVELLRRDCGVLVPYLDTDAMAAATLRLLSSPDDVRRLTSVGKDIVSREFDFSEYVRDLVRLAQPALISVVVPNFNYARYLPARLQSILTQTYRPCEVIFLDDCSTDASVDVARTILAGGGIPYRIITNERNRGVYPQWLRGIAEASGDLVWIAEADDDCSPRLLETLVRAFADPGVVLAYCQSRQVDEAGREIAPDYLGWTNDVSDARWRQPYVRSGAEEIADSLAVKNTIPNVSAVLMRRRDLSEIEADLLALRNAGDWFLYVHLLERGSIAFFPEPLNDHRRHSGSVTIGRGGLNLMRETLLVQRRISARHRLAPDIERKREAHLQATYQYLGLDAGGPASYKDHDELRPLAGVEG